MKINFATSIPDIYGGITPLLHLIYNEVALQTSNFTAIMEAYVLNVIMEMDYPACGRFIQPYLALQSDS
jgi:hypothetical protein